MQLTTPNNHAANNQAANNQAANNQAATIQEANDQAGDNQAANDQAADNQAANNRAQIQDRRAGSSFIGFEKYFCSLYQILFVYKILTAFMILGLI
jgi:hypothetical protein